MSETKKISIKYHEFPEDPLFSMKIKRCELEIGNQFFNLDDDDDFAILPLLNSKREIRNETVRNIQSINIINERLSDFIHINVKYIDKFDRLQNPTVKIPKEMIKITEIQEYDKNNGEIIFPAELKFRPNSRPKI